MLDRECGDSQSAKIATPLHAAFYFKKPIGLATNRQNASLSLSLSRLFVEMTGFEPVTSWLQTTRSPG